MHSIIPAFTAKVLIRVKTGVLGNDNNLLFLKLSMKKAQITMNFEADVIKAFRYNIPLIAASIGHYVLPLTKANS